MDLFNGKARQRAEELNELLQAMANGNLDQQIMQSSDPVWSGVYRQLALVQQRMSQLQQEVAQNESLEQGLMEMTRKHQDGWIDEVIPSQKLSGTHARIADGINALVAAHIAVKMQVVKVVSCLQSGRLLPAHGAPAGQESPNHRGHRRRRRTTQAGGSGLWIPACASRARWIMSPPT